MNNLKDFVAVVLIAFGVSIIHNALFENECCYQPKNCCDTCVCGEECECTECECADEECVTNE